MQMTPAAQAAIAKVQKLLALARNNDKEAEAQSAMNMAHRILEEHNLSISMLEATGKNADGTRSDKRTGKALYKWQREVWKSTSELNFCVYFSIRGLEKGSKYENRIVGSPVNVMATELMGEYLIDAIERLAREWARDRGMNIFTKDAIIYREGMAARVGQRLWDLRYERQQEEKRRREEAKAAGTENALVVIDDVKQREADLTNDYLEGWEPGTTAANRARRAAENAEWMEKKKAEKAEHERRMQTDPEYREKQEKIAAEAEAWWAAYQKKEARNAKRRKGTVYRETAEDRRCDSYAYSAGYRKGADIGLDPQVKAGKAKGAIQ